MTAAQRFHSPLYVCQLHLCPLTVGRGDSAPASRPAAGTKTAPSLLHELTGRIVFMAATTGSWLRRSNSLSLDRCKTQLLLYSSLVFHQQLSASEPLCYGCGQHGRVNGAKGVYGLRWLTKLAIGKVSRLIPLNHR